MTECKVSMCSGPVPSIIDKKKLVVIRTLSASLQRIVERKFHPTSPHPDGLCYYHLKKKGELIT